MDTPRNYRAGLYERVSKKTTGQDARSVAEQNAAGVSACQRFGWTIAAHYAEAGISASRHGRRQRPEWEKLRADVNAGLLDVVVLWEPSRGDRKLGAWAAFLDDCRERQVKIYITSHDRLYNPAGSRDRRSLAEDAVDAEYETDKTAERVQRAMTANLQKGKPHGPVPFGYIREYDAHRNLKAQVPDPKKAWVVREVIARVAAGEPSNAIANHMAARAAPTPKGGQWNASLVRRLVLSHAYAARRFYDPDRTGKGLVQPGMKHWEPLVDETTWQAAHELLVRRKRDSGHPGMPQRHLLSYLAVCGKCNGQLSVRQNRGVPLYFCKDKGCTAMRQDWLDAYVTGHACARLNTPAFWDELLNPDDAAAKAARAQAADLKRQLANWFEASMAEKVSVEAYGEAEARLKAQIADAERRGSVSTASPHLLAIYRQKDTHAVRELFEGNPVPTRKAILRDLYDEIALLPSGRRGRHLGFDKSRVRVTPHG